MNSPTRRNKDFKKTVDNFEYTFPTLVRYVGLVTTVILIGFCLAGYAVQAAPGFVAAGGMLLYKTVHKAAQRGSAEAEGLDDNVEE